MDLRTIERNFQPQCFACRYAGKYIVLWPQEPASKPEELQPGVWSFGSWMVYQNVHEPVHYQVSGSQRTLRSAHRSQDFCQPHWVQLFENWVQIAHDEVVLDDIFYRHLERTER